MKEIPIQLKNYSFEILNKHYFNLLFLHSKEQTRLNKLHVEFITVGVCNVLVHFINKLFC